MKRIYNIIDYSFYRIYQWRKNHLKESSKRAKTIAQSYLCFCYYAGSLFLLYFASRLVGLTNPYLIKSINIGYLITLFILVCKRYNDKYIERIIKRFRRNPYNKLIGGFVLIIVSITLAACWMYITIRAVNNAVDKYDLDGMVIRMIDWIY